MDGYKFERLSENNLHHLISLYKVCFNIKVDLDFLKKKYDTGSFGKKFMGYLAIEEKTGVVAGYYGVFPILCFHNSVKILAAQSGDTMTHPDHQGKGLFTKLASKTYELAKNESIKFVFGFPNKNSYPGFVKKLQWNHYGDVNNYQINTGSLPYDKLAKKFGLFNSLFQKRVASKLSKIQKDRGFENSLLLQNPKGGCVIHDDLFFKYKTYHHFYILDISGIRCIVKIDGRLWIGDIEFCEEERFLKTIGELVALAKKTGCSSVQFSVFNNTLYDNWLKKHYSVKSKNAVGCLNLDPSIEATTFCYQSIDFDTY